MKILLLGKNGQLGWELQRALCPLADLVALDRQSSSTLTGDLSDLDGIRETVKALAPDVVVNAAAYTAVDQAEEEQNLATQINANALQVISEEVNRLGSLLVHYSTDYVFNGEGEKPWREEDAPAPLNQYGASKLAGEKAILNSGCRHLLFRTSWVYAARGNNFLGTMEKLLLQKDSLNIVGDQIGAPTSAEIIADITAHAISKTLVNPDNEGLYHLAAGGETSWHGFCLCIANWLEENGVQLRTDISKILPIATADYPTKAQRPLNSRLNTEKLRKKFDLAIPHWKFGVQRALAERNI